MRCTRVFRIAAVTAFWFFVFVPGWCQCGKERWPVKTLADAQGPRVAKAPPSDTTVAFLTALPAPTKPALKRATSTRFPAELKVYRVHALLIGYKAESDSDYHIVISQAGKPWMTMIVEIPSGSCVPQTLSSEFNSLQEQFRKEFSLPGPRFRRLASPVPVVVTGVGFFDFLHGQTGVARNGFELHPVLSIEKDNPSGP